MRFLSFIFMISLLAGPVRAENNLIIKTYSANANDRVCTVTSKDIAKVSKYCPHPTDHLQYLLASSSEIYEWTIFQMAATLQIKKNKCIQERTKALLEDKEMMDEWMDYLVISWLGSKKSTMMLDRCRQISLKAQMRSFYSREPAVPRLWKDICDDPDRRAALEATTNIFQYSMPVASSPEFFKVMEENRAGIVSKKTGKPITDDEILGTDLSDVFSVIQSDDNSFRFLKRELKKKFMVLSNEREAMSQKILKSRSPTSKGFVLDEALRDAMFEEDTVMDVLQATKEIKTVNGVPEFSGGANCIMNRYEKSLGGEMAELVILGIFFSRVMPGAFNPARLKNLKDLSKAALVGSIPAGTFQGLREFVKTCYHSEYQDAKLIGTQKSQVKAFEIARDMPKSIGHKAFAMKNFPDDKAPSCKGIDANLMLGDFKRFTCIQNALLTITNFASLRLSLPILGYVLSE
jgi:hypothetical protein